MNSSNHSQINKEQLHAVASENNFIVQEVFNNEYVSRFSSGRVCDQSGTNMYMKLLGHQEAPHTTQNIETEINFYINANENGPLSRFVAKIEKYQKNAYPIWYVRDLHPGVSMGNFSRGFGYDKDKLRSVEPGDIITFLSSLWHFGELSNNKNELLLRRELYIPEYTLWWVNKNRHLLTSENVNRVNSFVETYTEPYKWSFWVMSHNDLWPENILLTEDGIQIIDWEHTGYNYPLFDAGLIVVSAWNDKGWYSDFTDLALHVFASFSNEVIGHENNEYNIIYFKMGYLYWMIVSLMKAEMHKGWLDINGRTLEYVDWQGYINSLNRQIAYILEK